MSIALQTTYKVLPVAPETLTVKDLTGKWSVTNTGGWDPTGANNPKASEATVAEIRIAKRNSDGSFGTETTVDVYNDLPSDVAGSVDIDSADAGQGGNYADGVYRMTYVVQGIWTSNSSAPFLTTSKKYVPLIPSICSCMDSVAIEAAKCTCNCGEINSSLSKLTFYMRLLEKAYECQDVVAMQAFIDVLTKLCAECTGCSGC